MYNTIIDPLSGNPVLTKSYLGKSIIRQYINNLSGAGESKESSLSSIQIKITTVHQLSSSRGMDILDKDLIWTFNADETVGDLTARIKVKYPNFPISLINGPQLFRHAVNRGSLEYIFPRASPPKMPLSLNSISTRSLKEFQYVGAASDGTNVHGFHLVLPDPDLLTT